MSLEQKRGDLDYEKMFDAKWMKETCSITALLLVVAKFWVYYQKY